MTKTIYNEYLVNSINQVLETYVDDKKRVQQLKSMIEEINHTHDKEKLNKIAEHLDYLINIIKHSSK